MLYSASRKFVVISTISTALLAFLFFGAQLNIAFADNAIDPVLNEGTGFIMGLVEGTDGNVPSEAKAILYKYEYNMFNPDYKPEPIDEVEVDPQTGAFMFENIGAGEYLIDILPSPETGYTPSLGYYAYLEEGDQYDLGTVFLSQARLIGKMIADDETGGPVDGWINLWSDDQMQWYSTEAVEGKFAFGSELEPGVYMIEGHPHPSEPYGKTEIESITIPNQGFATVTLTTSSPNVWGVVLDPDNNPMEHVDVFITDENGYWQGDYTANDGTWSLAGVPEGTYLLQAQSWMSNEYIAPEPIEITLPDVDQTFPLTMTFETFGDGNKTVSGQVLDNSGNPVTDAMVSAHHMDRYLFASTETDSEGNYELNLSGGEWSLFIDQIKVFNDTGCDPLSNPNCGDFGPNPECITQLDPGCEDECINPDEPGCEDNCVVPNGPFCEDECVSPGQPGCEEECIMPEDPMCMEACLNPSDPSCEEECMVPDEPGCEEECMFPDDPGCEEECNTPNNPMCLPFSTARAMQVANNSWFYNQEPMIVEFSEDDTVEEEEIIFEVERADSSITGKITMPDGSIPQFEVMIDVFNSEGFGGFSRMDWTTGLFTVPVTSGGYEVYIHPLNQDVEGPDMIEVFVDPGSIEDMGTIALIGSTASLQGKVIDSDDAGVGNVPITAWKIDGGSFRYQETNPNGEFSLNISPGTWHIMPSPHHDNDYIYSGFGQQITIEDGETITDVVFSMTSSNSTIEGRVVDSSGEFLSDTFGWVHIESIDDQTQEPAQVEPGPDCDPIAGTVCDDNQPDDFYHPSVVTGAPIINGQFDVNVPAGSYRMFTFVDGDGIFANVEQEVEIDDNETVEVEIVAATADSIIMGDIVDFRSGEVITNVQGMAHGWSQNGWADTFIEQGAGSYSMSVISGTWYIDFWLEEGDYVPLMFFGEDEPNKVTVGATETVTHNLTVATKDATISGSVLDPDGNPLARAAVFLIGEEELQGVHLWVDTDNSGNFTVQVPYGTYYLEAAFGNPDGEDNQEWFMPEPIEVVVESGDVSENNDVQFRAATATITGTVTATGATNSGKAFIWAWSEDGGFNHTEIDLTSDGTDATGTYSMGAIDGTWFIGAAYQNGTSYWFGEQQFTVAGDTTADLTLSPGGEMPEADTLVFDESEPATLELADGTEIFIPRGAMPVTGTITLSVEPSPFMPETEDDNVIGYGYAILARDSDGRTIEEDFDEDVEITFVYSEEDLNGIDENTLEPKYYSTTDNQWTAPTTFVIDTENNTITMQIRHFTDFAVVGDPTASTSNAVYLPFLFQD